jgi:thymidylate synthase ThyX
MSRTYSYLPDLQIASIQEAEKHQHMAVHALIQNPGKKQPSVTAYLGARYSRSADSITKIAAEAYEAGIDAASRLEQIFANYGHKSVGDMADLFVCIENIPILQTLKLFNLIPVVSGQERSTRYQNFAKPDYVHLPESKEIPKEVVDLYEKIMQKAYVDYAELLEPSKQALAEHFKVDPSDAKTKSVLLARAFDTVRYTIPLGSCTSLGILTSARVWSDTISFLRSSPALIERELAELVYDLLKGTPELLKLGYVPEVDGLIRHSDANYASNETTIKVLELLKQWKVKAIKRKLEKSPLKGIKVTTNNDAMASLLRNYQLLAAPLSADFPIYLKPEQWAELGEVIFAKHNQHNQLRVIGQQGAITIEAMADAGGVIKDLNRHRSMERIVPLFNENIDIDAELDRPNESLYFLCDYLSLPGLEALKAQYVAKLNETYQLIKDWLALSKDKIPATMRTEYARYLLPSGHATVYRFYASVDDLQYTSHLRSRNGGHIAYRAVSYAWLKELAKQNPFWKGMFKNIPEVAANSREQFLDRS